LSVKNLRAARTNSRAGIVPLCLAKTPRRTHFHYVKICPGYFQPGPQSQVYIYDGSSEAPIFVPSCRYLYCCPGCQSSRRQPHQNGFCVHGRFFIPICQPRHCHHPYTPLSVSVWSFDSSMSNKTVPAVKPTQLPFIKRDQ